MEWIKTKYPGIRYRLHATRKHGISADKYYVLTYKHEGKTRSEALGWASEGMTLDKATEAMAEIKTNQRAGTGPGTLVEKKRLALEAKDAEDAERKRIEIEKAAAEQAEVDRVRLESVSVFNAVLEQYCKSHFDKKSLREEKILMRLWVQPLVGSKRLQEINILDVERVKRNMLKAGRAVRTVQYAFAIIRQIYNYAKQRKLFDGESPTKGVKLPKIDNRRMRFLSPGEANALLDDLKSRSMVSYRTALLSLYSGMRFGEVAGLRWQHIDMENRQIVILDPKNGKTRFSFMADAVCQMFSEMAQGKPNDLVFESRTNKVQTQISDTFNRAVAKLGLNDGVEDRRMKVVFHTLRHSCASQLAMSGADLPTIQAVLGHKTLAMTERYSHLTNQHIKNAIGRLQDAMNPAKSNVIIPMSGRSG